MIAVSYERIHRSNLIGMGIMPLQFLPGQNADSLGLTGRERFSIEALPLDSEGHVSEVVHPGKELQVKVGSAILLRAVPLLLTYTYPG